MTSKYTIKVSQTDGNWQIGTINGIQFWAKVYNEPSENGVEGGNISKLTIKGVCDYERGWLMKPRSKSAKDMLAAMLDFFKIQCGGAEGETNE